MIDTEQLTVSGGLGTTTWTVTRGSGGTTAATHAQGAYVFQCATSLIPIEPLMFEPMIDRYNPKLVRNSFEAFYETVIVSQHSEFKGIKAPATFETLTNWLSYAVKGGVTPTTSDSAAYTWNFTPTLTADDLTGLGAESGNDTGAYHIAALYCDELIIDIARGKESAMATATFLGQQAFKMGAKTPGLTRTGLNIINPAFTKTYLDTTTIGTTLNNDLQAAKLTLKNAIQQLYFLNGFLYPTGIARAQRNLDIELTKWFDEQTELDAYLNSIGNGTERKLRWVATGPVIPGSSSTNALQVDFYGYYDTNVFKQDNAVWMLTLVGRSVFDVGAGNSWSISLTNSLSAVP